MQKTNTPFVFVYGSLRVHEGNHRLLASSELVCKQCSTDGRLYDTGYGFPAMIQSRGERVYGEMYRVTPEILKRLDALEGYYGEGRNNHYERVVQTIYTDMGNEEAYVYVYPESKANGLEYIKFGDWKFYRIQKHDEDIIYFAYGSCMDNERFKLRNKDHLFQDIIGRGVIEGYSLKFTRKASDGGKADMVEIGGVVEGKVYRVGHKALEYLLEREGALNYIYRPAFIDIRVGDKVVKDVLTFLVIDNAKEEVAPPEKYLEEIRRGGKTVWSVEFEKQFEEEIEQKFATVFQM